VPDQSCSSGSGGDDWGDIEEVNDGIEVRNIRYAQKR